MIIYHNPRCRKSRETLALIREKGIDPEVIEYLKTPLSKEELRRVLGLLGIPASGLLRRGERVFKELYKGKDLDEEAWLDALVTHPVLMERPVVVSGDRAVIGRPPENVEVLL